jgi:DNA-directed RNA polymerase specialized sigma24 family protein
MVYRLVSGRAPPQGEEGQERGPHHQREVLEMAYMRGWSQQEIAEHTGIPLGTVKTRTRLALKKLRRSLEPLMKEPVDLDGV